MSRLKQENINRCMSMLSEFIQDSGATIQKKDVAILALNHLRKITAGAVLDGEPAVIDSDGGPQCISKLLADPSAGV